MMLQRNLLYTGVTRAKKALVLVGQKKAVGYCVRNVTVDKRNTLLAERLSGKVSGSSVCGMVQAGSCGSRFVCFDVETPNRWNNRISAIGISVVENGRIIDNYYSLVDPEQPFDRFNSMLTGINEETVFDAPCFPEIWEEIEPLMSSGILVAHNAGFDMGVLRKCLSAYEIAWRPTVRGICTVIMGRSLLPGISHRLNDMCDYYGICLNHHQADSDSRACAEILIRYMEGGAEPGKYIRSYRMD
jgi:DNA polymerase-3 subunit epsilon